MDDKENRPKLLSCMIRGPGPAYKLPTLVGYDGHCPSRPRNPAFSIRTRIHTRVQSVAPGPKYNVHGLTSFGPDNPPAYSIAGREPFKIRDLGPGPGAHYPEHCPPMNHNVRAPAYTIQARISTKYGGDGPGPNAYVLPTCIGPKIPDKSAQGAFSIGGFQEIKRELIGPGPAAYSNMDHDLIKHQSPAYTMKWRHTVSDTDITPGPKYYSRYNPGRRPPMYSFGIRHSECAGTAITDLDED